MTSSRPRLHLLPGLHGTAALFGPLREAAGAHTSVTEYSENTAPTAESIIERISETVPRDEPFVLVAESFAGPFAARFAAERPQGLVGLVFACTFLRVPHRFVLRALPPIPCKPPWWLSRRIVANGVTDPAVIAAARDIEVSLSLKLVRGRLRLLAATDAREPARSITVPTLVVHGRNDRLVPIRHGRSIAAHVPGCVFRDLPGPHLLLQARAREVWAEIEGWLA